MKSMKIMLSAMLLTASLGGFAQDDDELLGLTVGEETVDLAEVSAPTTPSEKPFFHRVHIGYTGTNVKYTNFGQSPDYNNHFLSGVSVGWTGDFKLLKTQPFYLELGATLTYHTGKSTRKLTATIAFKPSHLRFLLTCHGSSRTPSTWKVSPWLPMQVPIFASTLLPTVGRQPLPQSL